MVTDAARRRRKHGSTGYRGCESRALPHGVFGSFLTSTSDQKHMGGVKGIGLFYVKDYKSGLYVHKWTYTANDYNGVLKLQAL
jgi:hypothetical protein